MHKKTALIFGYNKYGFEIAQNITQNYEKIQIYSQNENDKEYGEHKVDFFDLSDDWKEVEEFVDIENSIAFCVLEDDAENIFLTISLRAYFEELTIIAITSNKESVNKLTMAGANKVIPLVETTADIISNILELPISNKVLQSILFEENDLKVAQIKIDEHTNIKDEQIMSIDWGHYNGIVVLSLIHENMKSEFIYSSKVKRHVLQTGDTLVVVGYDNDIQEFRKLIGSKE